jgi:hypothetical protein
MFEKKLKLLETDSNQDEINESSVGENLLLKGRFYVHEPSKHSLESTYKKLVSQIRYFKPQLPPFTCLTSLSKKPSLAHQKPAPKPPTTKALLVNQIRRTFEGRKPRLWWEGFGGRKHIERKRLVMEKRTMLVTEQHISMKDKLKRLSQMVKGVGKGQIEGNATMVRRMQSRSPGKERFYL